MTDWKSVPKTELHLHLEGAAPPAFVRLLAEEKGIALDGVFDADGNYAWSNFAEFLATYERACEVLQSPDDLRRLVEAVLTKSADDGVIYTELFLAPDLYGDGSVVAWKEYLAAMTEGAESARAGSGIETRFIATAVRHFGPERALNTATVAAGTAGGILTGFGMGGEERHGHLSEYSKAYAAAGEAGLGLTVHAGEICGAESVTAALDHLNISRIGHGVRAIEDPKLVARLAEEKIVLEVNPGSNIALDVYPDWAAHPIEHLRQAGVAVTVSTDDPPYFYTDMVSEYVHLSKTFGWKTEDFRETNITAMKAAFCDEATRGRLIAAFEGDGK